MQGFGWYFDALKRDADGDEAHEFVTEEPGEKDEGDETENASPYRRRCARSLNAPCAGSPLETSPSATVKDESERNERGEPPIEKESV